MEILLWLVPPFVVAVLAMAWVAWVSREGRGEIDPDERVRLIGAALEREPRHLRDTGERQPVPLAERSTGVAVRKTIAG